jgi:putative glutamine amidotransferase
VTTMSSPVIGIVGADHVVPRFWGQLEVTGTPTSYVDAVLGAGGLPVVVPGRAPDSVLALVDALVLTGGGDVDPARYGGDPSGATEVDPARDEAELRLVRAAAGLGLPVLGVCRGLQLLAVASGGRLSELGEAHVLPTTGHRVALTAGSRLAGLLGPSPVVSSIHHQAVAEPGQHWTVTARAADGVIEGCEWTGPDAWPVLAVQWHPERDHTGPALFGWLVASAATYRRAASPPAGRPGLQPSPA